MSAQPNETAPNETAPNEAAPNGTAPAIELLDVTKRYFDGEARLIALRKATLAVPRGALWVLEGPSGSGKTTLLALMGAMLAPTRGEVKLLGKGTAHLRDHHRTLLRRRTVGFAFQHLSLIAGMSLLENVLLPLVPTGGPQGSELVRAHAVLERFGLTARIHADVSRLSGGERQRAAIARALVREPPIVLLDEPTAHLDADNAAELLGLLAELTSEGRTIVIAIHDARVAEHPAVDARVSLRDGALSLGPMV